MGQKITIRVGTLTLAAELNDSPASAAVAAALPIQAKGNCWGEEIYFRIPVKQPEAKDARAEMAVGELAYWPPGNAFCIFFGPTPASIGQEPRAASPVNPIGRVTGDVGLLRQIADGSEFVLEKA